MAKQRGGIRPGAGRPKTMESGLDVTVRLPQADVDAVQKIARRESMTMSAVIRMAVRRWLNWRRKKH